MALLDGGFDLDLGGGCGVKVVFRIGFERRLVALEGEHVIGFVGDDLVGDLDLTAHGVDGHQRAFELPGLREFIEEIRDGGDLVGLFRHAELRQDQPCRGRVSAERVQGFEPLAAVVGAPRGLAVDGDEVVPVRPQRRHPTCKAASEQDRIDPIDQLAQPALARNTVMKLREPAQEIEVVPAPGTHVVEIVTEAIVAQVTSSITSLSGYITRQGSRSSPSWEKCFRRTATRARGTSSSRIEAVRATMLRSVPNQSAHGITALASIQNY